MLFLERQRDSREGLQTGELNNPFYCEKHAALEYALVDVSYIPHVMEYIIYVQII